ncbi:MAG: type VII toxin-antitoxin system HepT family RNase toxin [Myxococcota bacterium]
MTQREQLAVLLRSLDEALADLEQYAREVPLERLMTDRHAFRMVSNALYVAAQSAIDIAEVLLANRKLGPASSYREAFVLLARSGVLPAPLAHELEGWAGLRNVLAHIYTQLDLERLHRAYTAELGALRELRKLATQATG